jgi:hypothetical protein
MDQPTRAPRAVVQTVGRLNVPEPYPADYGSLRDEVFAYIDAHTDQEELAKGEPGQHFEW